MYTLITNYIKRRIVISTEEVEESLSYCSYRKYVKGEYILRIGEYCRIIGFINKGIMVTTFIDETGNEKAAEFKHEGCFFTYTEGLAENAPSHKNFIALEDCETLLIQKEFLPLIFNQNAKFETLFSQILAEELRSLLLNDQKNKTVSVENRYRSLEDSIPDALQRIPVKYIAGYLGIEAPSLSRLRRRITGKRK